MSERDWINEANLYLKDKYAAVVGQSDISEQQLPKYTPQLELLESKYFMLGLKTSLFTIDSNGYIQSPTLPPPRPNNTKQQMYQLFWHSSHGRYLYREGVCHLAMISYLILEHGWEIKEVVAEPSGAKYGKLSYAVDMLIVSLTVKY